MGSPKNWTEIITPNRNLFSLNIKEVIKYKDLVFLFVKRDFVAYYKQTILGPAWYIIQPLIQTMIFSVIFGSFISTTDGIPKFLFYLSGTTTWWYFSQCLTKTSNIFKGNEQLFGKVYFPRLTVPFSVILSNLIGYSIQFGLFVAVYSYFVIKGDVQLLNPYKLLLLPLLVLIMAFLSLGMGIIISSLTTKYKDFTHFIGFGVQLMFYASPVIYPLSEPKLPIKFRILLEYNPMSPIIEGLRAVFFSTPNFDFYSIIYSAIFALLVFIIGALLFNKTEQNFMDTI